MKIPQWCLGGRNGEAIGHWNGCTATPYMQQPPLDSAKPRHGALALPYIRTTRVARVGGGVGS